MNFNKGKNINHYFVIALLIALGFLLASMPARAGAGGTGLAAFSARQQFLGPNAGEQAPPGGSDLNSYQPEGAGADPAALEYCSPDIPDMIAYWPLNDPVNPAVAKQTFANLVAPLYNGFCTNPGCPAREASGKVGAAYAFSPANNPPANLPDQIDVPPFPALDWTVYNSFSFETWVKIPATATCSGNRVFIGRRGQGVMSIWLGCADGANVARFSVRDNTGVDDPPGRYIVTGKTVLNDGKWHHVAGVRDAVANTLNLYVDGVLESSVTTAYTMGFSGGKTLGIGYFNTGFEPYYFLDGSLDEVAIYKRALTLDNVKSHWNGGVGKPYCTSGSRVTIPIVLHNNPVGPASSD